MNSGPPKKRHRSWHPTSLVPVPPTAVPVPALRPIVCSPGQSLRLHCVCRSVSVLHGITGCLVYSLSPSSGLEMTVSHPLLPLVVRNDSLSISMETELETLMQGWFLKSAHLRKFKLHHVTYSYIWKNWIFNLIMWLDFFSFIYNMSVFTAQHPHIWLQSLMKVFRSITSVKAMIPDLKNSPAFKDLLK